MTIDIMTANLLYAHNIDRLVQERHNSSASMEWASEWVIKFNGLSGDSISNEVTSFLR